MTELKYFRKFIILDICTHYEAIVDLETGEKVRIGNFHILLEDRLNFGDTFKHLKSSLNPFETH